jgi:hypothetical protein
MTSLELAAEWKAVEVICAEHGQKFACGRHALLTEIGKCLRWDVNHWEITEDFF